MVRKVKHLKGAELRDCNAGNGIHLADALGDGRVSQIVIPAPKLRVVTIPIVGTSPYVQNRFSEKALNQIIETQKAGSTARGKRKREPKDFDAAFAGARHVLDDGSDGIPASAFRSACISACRVAQFKMTLAKLSIFVLPDGFDRIDGTPLVKIIGPKPQRHQAPARNTSGGVDVRTRPMWRQWSANVRIRFDADQFTEQDVANLMMRAGMQVGIGEGRPDSPNSNGQGWGTFEIKEN